VRRWWGDFVGTHPTKTGVVAEGEVLVDDEPAGWVAGC
jgi:hypothetical protein